MKDQILQQFEQGNYNLALIASRLSTTYATVKHHIYSDERLKFMRSDYLTKEADDKAKLKREIAAKAAEIGTRPTAAKYSVSVGFVQSAIYAEKKYKELNRQAKEVEKKAGYFHNYFPY